MRYVHNKMYFSRKHSVIYYPQSFVNEDFLQAILSYFEIIADSQAGVRNNIYRHFVSFIWFPPMVTFCKIIWQHHTQESACCQIQVTDRTQISPVCQYWLVCVHTRLVWCNFISCMGSCIHHTVQIKAHHFSFSNTENYILVSYYPARWLVILL